MSFATSIHCMDGRIQKPIIDFIKSRYGVEHVDCVTEPGACMVLADDTEEMRTDLILERVSLSVRHHGSKTILLSGHHDCAGNPEGRERQVEQIRAGLALLSEYFPEMESAGLWVNEDWEVEVI